MARRSTLSSGNTFQSLKPLGNAIKFSSLPKIKSRRLSTPKKALKTSLTPSSKKNFPLQTLEMPSKEKEVDLQKFTSTPYARSSPITKPQKSRILKILLWRKEEKEGLVVLKIKNPMFKEILNNQALILKRNKLFRAQMKKEFKMVCWMFQVILL